MKKIGIVGGVAWSSTMDYYSGICRLSERKHLEQGASGVPSMPEMSIESLDLARAISYIGTDEDDESWSQFDDYHRAALQRLEASGAEVAVIASNTPHHRFEAIVRGVGIPVINIFDAAARETARTGAGRVLILGTPVTMKSQKIREAFANHGIDATGLDDDSAIASTVALIEDLQRGKCDDAFERLAQIAIAAFDRQGLAERIVCLACTELRMGLHAQGDMPVSERGGVTYVDTTAAHIRALLDQALG